MDSARSQFCGHRVVTSGLAGPLSYLREGCPVLLFPDASSDEF